MCEYRFTLLATADCRYSRCSGDNNFIRNARTALLYFVGLMIVSICAGVNCAYSQSNNSGSSPGDRSGCGLMCQHAYTQVVHQTRML
jgi:hypothetical protein